MGPVKRSRNTAAERRQNKGDDGDQLARGAADEADEPGDAQQHQHDQIEEGQALGPVILRPSGPEPVADARDRFGQAGNAGDSHRRSL
jgi:hypothetical protein